MSCETIKRECYLTDKKKFEKFIGDNPDDFDWTKLYQDGIIPNKLKIDYIKIGYLRLENIKSLYISNIDQEIFIHFLKNSSLNLVKQLFKISHYALILKVWTELSPADIGLLKKIEDEYSKSIDNLTMNQIIFLAKNKIITNKKLFLYTSRNMYKDKENISILIDYLIYLSQENKDKEFIDFVYNNLEDFYIRISELVYKLNLAGYFSIEVKDLIKYRSQLVNELFGDEYELSMYTNPKYYNKYCYLLPEDNFYEKLKEYTKSKWYIWGYFKWRRSLIKYYKETIKEINGSFK